MSYIKLQGHYTDHSGGGMAVGEITLTITLGNGDAVELPIPFLTITNGLGICPDIAADGDGALRLDFTKWSPVRYGREVGARFPFNFSSQTLAVRVARAFDADPATSWRDSYEQMTTWFRTWGPEHDVRLA